MFSAKTNDRPHSDFVLYRRLIKFAFRYWRAMVLLVLGVIVGAAMEPLLPALMKPLVDQSLVGQQHQAMWVVPSLLVLVVFVRGIADYTVTYFSQYVAQRTVQDLRQALFSKELSLSLSRHSADEGGRMLTRITFDPQMVAEAVTEVWMVLIRDSLVLVGLIGFLLYTAWELAALVFLCFPLLILAVRKISNRLRTSSSNMQARVGRVSGFIQEALTGLREVKIFNASVPQEKLFFELNQSLRKEEMRIVRTSALAGPLVALMTSVTVAIVIYLASSMTAIGKLTPGEFVAFITALAMIFGPMRRLTAVNIVLQKGLAAAEVIFGLIDTPDERGEVITERTLAARHQFHQAKNSVRPRARGDIVFDHVSFIYPNQTSPALSELSFTISSGEAVALLGPSGSGKSSVLSLLARFYLPSSGEISLDGLSLKKWDLEELRGNLALVGQNVVLFDDTVGNNIRFGKEGASDEEVLRAAKAAHAWEFIERLPKKLDTPIGSLGDRLSGGQRQRIAIARAFLKDAPILLLDEATSALDRESEEAVLNGLERLIQGRTVLMVSHSPERLRGVTRTIILSGLNGS